MTNTEELDAVAEEFRLKLLETNDLYPNRIMLQEIVDLRKEVNNLSKKMKVYNINYQEMIGNEH